jgi:hypothetical protein
MQKLFKKIILVSALLMSFGCGVAMAQNDPIITQSTSTTTTNGSTTTKVESPPPSAISPTITTINSDVCAVGFGGAAQTQILGISFGGTSTDWNCERLKLSKTLFDMGMKVAAVSVMCQDRRVWDAMMSAGTPCPIDGKIGQEAKLAWDENPQRQPKAVNEKK